MTHAPGARTVGRPLAALAVVLLVAACGAAPSPTPSGPASASPAASNPASPGEASPEPSSAVPTPAASGEPAPSGTGSPTPAATEPAGSPAASPTAGAARACTGSDENRAFYVAVAEAVDWDVYCPVLPSGWYVDTGSFRLANGGKLEISYKGPVGQRIEIREGAYCLAADGCAPTEPDSGAASFGGRAARLFVLGGGSVLVLAQGESVGWEAKGLGLDAATLTGLTASFAVVAR